MSRHDCPGLAQCINHPRWHVLAPDSRFRTWGVYAPWSVADEVPFDTLPEAITYATARTRADMVAAVQNGAGR